MKHSIVIAADKSGSGKTTLTCGLIHVLKKRGLKVQSFKCGPDYLDPMFHKKVLGVPSANLDSFFVSKEILKKLYAERAEKAEVSVIEGVMGYYDGLGGISSEASTWEIADIIDSPTVLLMDCKGASVSIAALIRGMLDFTKSDSGIRGVILNRVAPMFYERLKGVIEDNCPEIKVLGYMPEMKNLTVPSRHLGLIEPGDMEDFNSWIEAVGEQIEKTVLVDGLLEIAETTKSGKTMESKLSEFENGPEISYKLKNKVRIGIAEDEAFNFYYRENRELLEKMGAEIVSFSPLHDEILPDDLDGIIIGGGYPELYAETLSANVSMREALASSIKNGIPVIAECGGYMYLNNSISAVGYGNEKNTMDDKPASGKVNSEDGIRHYDNLSRNKSGTENSYQMCGILSGNAQKRERLVRFGYVSAETKASGLFGDAGTVLKGHEFHRYDCEYNGDGFVLRKPKAGNDKINSTFKMRKSVQDDMKNSPGNTSMSYENFNKTPELSETLKGYEGIYYSETMSCGWPHFYYYSNPKAIFNYMKCCERYHFEREAQKKWDGIAKPIDSLGVLEKEVIKLCGIQRTLTPDIDKKALVVLCADHGCVKEGVTQTDSSVTRKVADSFAKGATTTAIFAEKNGVSVYTLDVGMLGPRYGEVSEERESEGFENRSDEGLGKLYLHAVNDRRLQDGSGNIAVEPAMSHEVGEKALKLGMDIVRELKEDGYRIIATGEMGIGNTTPTAALLAYFMGSNAEEAAGYGAGLSEDGLKRKQDVVRKALERLGKELRQKESEAETAKEVLFRIGGLEIAVMAGMFLGGVRYEVPIVVDGIISTAAALSAYMMDERVGNYALASHVSKEKLARKALEKMGLRAIIDAEMSLGEGSGAVLLMPILSSAVEAFNRMGSFSDMEVEAYHRFSH
ncbi:cobyrinate a,c-diamide synthase [Oribacterium sp. P6A1]|uniref:cobyrinate a,c-diamide synthase n=1 Tax=Oribacterium sp. P6A1 TaxID=1410612 RepID=UPI000691EA6A|nr:cobyrinate a,c-diamide synthase [Oribacterium sp. P6A1]